MPIPLYHRGTRRQALGVGVPEENSHDSDIRGADELTQETLRWSPAAVVDVIADDGGAGSEVDDVDVSSDADDLDLSGAEAAENGRSERAAELSNDHWRERAIVWRERALAAELVSRMLQRNLDDLRANLDDLRREAEAVRDAQQHSLGRGTASPTTLSPWRQYLRDLYDKYLR
jgi:hypothetical protein